MNQFSQAESLLILTPRDFHIIDLAMRAAERPPSTTTATTVIARRSARP